MSPASPPGDMAFWLRIVCADSQLRLMSCATQALQWNAARASVSPYLCRQLPNRPPTILVRVSVPECWIQRPSSECPRSPCGLPSRSEVSSLEGWRDHWTTASFAHGASDAPAGWGDAGAGCFIARQLFEQAGSPPDGFGFPARMSVRKLPGVRFLAGLFRYPRSRSAIRCNGCWC